MHWAAPPNSATGSVIGSGDLLAPAAADAMRLVQKELPVPQRRFRILVYGHDDGLDMLVAPSSGANHLRRVGPVSQ
jgi:hypothetical protein